MDYEAEFLINGMSLNLSWSGYLEQDHTGKWYPVFIEDLEVFCDGNHMSSKELKDEWEELEQFCTDYMYDREMGGID